MQLLEKPLKKRPESFNEVAGGLTMYSPKRTRKPNVPEITSFFMEKNFGKERRKHGYEKWTKHFNTFRKTFITNNKRAIQWYRQNLKVLFMGSDGLPKTLPITIQDPSLLSILKSMYPRKK